MVSTKSLDATSITRQLAMHDRALTPLNPAVSVRKIEHSELSLWPVQILVQPGVGFSIRKVHPHVLPELSEERSFLSSTITMKGHSQGLSLYEVS